MDQMNQGKKLAYCLYAYYTIKIVHFFFQIGLVFYLFGFYDNEEDKVGFAIIDVSLLVLILISFYIKSKHAETLQLRILMWERTLIVMEIIILVFSVFGYVVLSILIGVKYKDLGEKEKLYYAHHSNRLSEVQFKETNTNPAYISDTTDKLIETTTNFLVPDGVSLSNLISLMNVKENSSEKMDPSVNSCETTMNESYVPDSCKQMFEDFYYSYIVLELVLPNIINIIPFAIILATLVYSEYIKGEIRELEERFRYARDLVARDVVRRASSSAHLNESFQGELDTTV